MCSQGQNYPQLRTTVLEKETRPGDSLCPTLPEIKYFIRTLSENTDELNVGIRVG